MESLPWLKLSEFEAKNPAAWCYNAIAAKPACAPGVVSKIDRLDKHQSGRKAHDYALSYSLTAHVLFLYVVVRRVSYIPVITHGRVWVVW